MYKKIGSKVENENIKEFSLELNKECSSSLEEATKNVLEMDLNAIFQKYSADSTTKVMRQPDYGRNKILQGIRKTFEFGGKSRSQFSILNDIFMSYENCLLVMRMNLLQLWSIKSDTTLPVTIAKTLLCVIYASPDEILAHETHRVFSTMLFEETCFWIPAVEDIHKMLSYFGASEIFNCSTNESSVTDCNEWTQSAHTSLDLGLNVLSAALEPTHESKRTRLQEHFQINIQHLCEMLTIFLLLAGDSTVQV